MAKVTASIPRCDLEGGLDIWDDPREKLECIVGYNNYRIKETEQPDEMEVNLFSGQGSDQILSDLRDNFPLLEIVSVSEETYQQVRLRIPVAVVNGVLPMCRIIEGMKLVELYSVRQNTWSPKEDQNLDVAIVVAHANYDQFYQQELGKLGYHHYVQDTRGGEE